MRETMENNEKVFMLSHKFFIIVLYKFYIIVDYSWHLSVLNIITILHVSETFFHVSVYIYIYTYTCHIDLSCLIKMKYKTLVHIEHFEYGTLVICPTLLIPYYFHMTKLTKHVFLSKLPLKVSKLI